LEEKTRGLIENALDEAIESLDVKDISKWVLDAQPYLITSREDFVLGYVLGSMSRFAHRRVWMSKLNKESEKRQKKMDEDFEKKHGRKPPKTGNGENVKPYCIRMTKKNTAEIRDILRNRILDLRDAIHRGFRI